MKSPKEILEAIKNLEEQIKINEDYQYMPGQNKFNLKLINERNRAMIKAWEWALGIINNY